MERIQCSAIYYNDGKERAQSCRNTPTGIVVCGLRHCNCFPILFELFPEKEYIDKHVQGFVTSDNRFVDRTEGYKIALAANQCEESIHNILMSEDLY